eukprot:4859362-Amphidinium_carterae.1
MRLPIFAVVRLPSSGQLFGLGSGLEMFQTKLGVAIESFVRHHRILSEALHPRETELPDDCSRFSFQCIRFRTALRLDTFRYLSSKAWTLRPNMYP